MEIGKHYNWKHQKERLIYLGYNFSGNGYWHQFALIDSPNQVWCECLDSDLLHIEETKLPEEVQTEILRLSQGLNELWRSKQKPKNLNFLERTERNRRKRARKTRKRK